MAKSRDNPSKKSLVRRGSLASDLIMLVAQIGAITLGDNRDEAVDSRIVGCVPVDQTLGKVIGLFRRRGF